MAEIPIVPAAAGSDETPAARLPRYARPGVLRFAAQPPLGLYVHIPWCLRKCPYCDFNSHAVRDGEPPPLDRYLDALIADLEASLPLVWGRPVTSVFIGGGTPSLAAPDQIDRLVAGLRARLVLEPGCEITLEANPGTFERDRFRGYRDAGITRLSIGVQSFDDTLLGRIGRVHDGAQARLVNLAMGLGLFVATIFLLSFVLGNFSVVTLVVTWMAFSQINLHNHTLWEADRFPFRYMSYLSRMHHNHHARFTGGNFATISLLYDWMFGTLDHGTGWRRDPRRQDARSVA